jgi:hypothetical protein
MERLCIDCKFLKSELVPRVIAHLVPQSCETFYKVVNRIVLKWVCHIVWVCYGPIPIGNRLPPPCTVASAPGMAIVSIIPGASQFPMCAAKTGKEALNVDASGQVSAIDDSQLYFAFPLTPLNPRRDHLVCISPILFGDGVGVREMTKCPEPMPPSLL